jgi:hypothetical protein
VTPAFFAFPFIKAWRAGADRGAVRPDGLGLVLPIVALGYLGFVWLWNFDLGFPADYDLMTSLGIALNLYVLHLVLALWRRSRGLAYLGVAMGSIYIWFYMFRFLNTIP